MNKPLNKMAVQATINGESTAFLCSPGRCSPRYSATS